MNQEMSAFAKKRRSKKIRRFLFLAILLIALLGTSGYFVMEKFFVVKEISVQKSDIYKTEDISDCVNVKKGIALYKIDKQKIVEKVEAKFPYLEDVKISFKLPDKVQISFREEYGKFSVPLGVELFALDDNMLVLAKETGDSGIKRIEIVSGDVKTCFVGESITFIDEDTAPILRNLVKALRDKKMIDLVSRIDVTNQFDIRVDYDGRFEFALGDHQDFSLKLAMVEKILEDLGSGASGIIDISDSDQAYVKVNDPVA